MRLPSKSSTLLSLVMLQLVSAIDMKRQASETLLTSVDRSSPTPSNDCFNTILTPTSTCSTSRGTTLNCQPSIATTTVCKPDKNCFKDSQKQDVCLPRNDKVAPAGIIFAVGVAIVVTIITVTLIMQRIQQKRKIMQARDDRLRGVHMGMTGSQKVEVTFVESGLREGDGERLLHDIPPAYTEADRRRGVPSVSLNGGALPAYDDDEHRRSGRL